MKPALAVVAALAVGFAVGGAPSETRTAIANVNGDQVEWIVGSPGQTLAFAVREHGGVTVYRNAQSVGTYDAAFPPIFSSNGAAFAFLVTGSGGSRLVVSRATRTEYPIPTTALDPQALAFSVMSGVALSHDGASFAYRSVILPPAGIPPPPAVGGMSSGPPLVMIVEGTAALQHMEVGVPVFHPTQNELMYRVRDAGSPMEALSYIVKGGAAQTKYGLVMDPVYSSTGAKYGYVARMITSSNFIVVVNGTPLVGSYDYVLGLTFSPNGQKVAFITGFPGTSQTAVVDGHAGASFISVGPIVFSPDSLKYGYVGYTASDSVLLVDGAEIARHQNARAFGPYFGPHNRVAYILQEGVRSYLVLDGHREGPYAVAGYPIFSADGQHVAYGVIDGLTQRAKIISDGAASPAFVATSIPRFTGNNTLEYYAAMITPPSVEIVKMTKTF